VRRLLVVVLLGTVLYASDSQIQTGRRPRKRTTKSAVDTIRAPDFPRRTDTLTNDTLRREIPGLGILIISPDTTHGTEEKGTE
jgi:hypothetical protein